MTQNERKEPTFGKPKLKSAKNIIPSLKTKQSPGHTFTPVIKPAGSAKLELPKMEGGDAPNPADLTFSPVSENVETDKKVEMVVEKIEAVQLNEVKSVAQDAVKVALNTAERVIPTTKATKTVPENNVAKETSSKHRRLGIVALLAVVLGAVFFWLKPNTTETVEELQSQQNGSLPIEFRPVDEAEAQRQEAEAKAKVEQEAVAQQQAQSQPTENTALSSSVNPTPALPPVTQPIANELAQPQVNQSQPVEKPATQGSVVYQPEQLVTKPQAQKPTVHRVEKARPNQVTNQPKGKAVTKTELNAKKTRNAQLDRLVKNVETGKTDTKAVVPSLAAKMESSNAKNAVASSKTLTVPKGISLMQVFRDNQLNISDVNAMSKVNSKVSNLKVNEKVTVRLDKNNRVVEMAIGSGGKFTRQADGSYSFK